MSTKSCKGYWYLLIFIGGLWLSQVNKREFYADNDRSSNYQKSSPKHSVFYFLTETEYSYKIYFKAIYVCPPLDET